MAKKKEEEDDKLLKELKEALKEDPPDMKPAKDSWKALASKLPKKKSSS